MADEKKRMTDLPEEDSVDISDLLALGSNGTSSLKKATIGKLLGLIYPVGSIFTTEDRSFDPGQTFGGRWERKTGVFLFAADDAHPIGSTGGSADVTLTVENLPPHSHAVTLKESPDVQTNPDEGGHEHYGKYSKDVSAGTSGKSRYFPDGKETAEFPLVSDGTHVHTLPAHTHATTCGETGSGAPYSNMPPYASVYMWRRVG